MQDVGNTFSTTGEASREAEVFPKHHSTAYLKGPYDKITSVAIPVALAGSAIYLIPYRSGKSQLPSMLLVGVAFVFSLLGSNRLCFSKFAEMPKVKTNRIKYPDGWELIEPTLRELDAKMREAENDRHDGKRKCETLWPIFRIAHQRSRYILTFIIKRMKFLQSFTSSAWNKTFGKFRYCQCPIELSTWMDQLCQDMNDSTAYAAFSQGITTLAQLVFAGSPSI
ncbi:hypothetical protein GH714_000897 [Hevea brasiliensis]|uniref:Uncharacterized protein n=1 Tax=Hevea brasiliensis TaxID=3981 RepID=A0A6A6NAS4_HEVBR|nr:hypothetical protein GH714_000897 [Hevea brasiliensis]